MAEREARALAYSGVADVLTKPAQSEEVLRIVSRVLAANRTREYRQTPFRSRTAFDREHLPLVTDKLSETAGDLRATNVRLRALIKHRFGAGIRARPDRLLPERLPRRARPVRATYVTLGILNSERPKPYKHSVICGADADN